MGQAFAEIDLSSQPDECLYIYDGRTGDPQRALFLAKPVIKSGELNRNVLVVLTTPDGGRLPVKVTSLRRTFTDGSLPEQFRTRQVIEMMFRICRPVGRNSRTTASA